ncbi:hypothetical protein SAMN04489752_2415 [Brevibacterium siliguriense]|uniref:Uncharacterized protein n=1 Tax=Brevibacterium siliguriense TaxID=1136497 RepID=A0A1H1UQU8_9MICO|nr:hypothetical protein SAMN04489752_2415 [Brevibacterium siliguriense]
MEREVRSMKGLLGMKWAILPCVLLLGWQLGLDPVVSSRTGVWVSTGISLMV